MLGINFVKSKDLAELRKDLEYVQEWKGLWANRPALDKLVTRDASGTVIQLYPFSPVVLYGMALHIDALRIVLERLREEIFRNGINIVERYAYKCLNPECRKEFESLPENELTKQPECDTCGSNKLARPLPKNRLKLRELMEKPVNQNLQTLKQVLFQIEWDMDTFDNGWMLLLKEYNIDPHTGLILERNIVEILRGDPLQLFFVADSTGKIGYQDEVHGSEIRSTPVLVCPRPDHRQSRIVGERCGHCGAVGVMAVAQVKSAYAMGRSSAVPEIYYIEGEVLHSAKYQPGLLYGYSPIYALWMKVMSLFYQDRYIMKYYDKQRSPRAMFAVGTKSLASFTKAWDQLKVWAREDPEEIHPLAVETDKAGRSIVQFIDLMHTLNEMQYVEQRNEFRRTVGAEYGVLPLFSGDLPTGWNNEGMQVTVTNRAVKAGQVKIVEGFLDKLLQRLGVHDWRFEFNPSEEADELRGLQIQGQELANAEALKRMGFKIWFDHTGKLKHSKVPIEPTVDPMMDNGGLSDKRPNAPTEEMGNFEGEPNNKRPSDVGGMMEGHPASGEGTSLSMKFDVEKSKKKIHEEIARELDYQHKTPLQITDIRAFAETVFWGLNDDGVKTSADEVEVEFKKYKDTWINRNYIGLSNSMSTGQSMIGEIMKHLDEDTDFESSVVSKAIADMKTDATRQAWLGDYVDVPASTHSSIRVFVQSMFEQEVSKKAAITNLIGFGVPLQQAELIVKTEYNMMLNRARELAYKQTDPDGTRYKYYWDVSHDDHVCPACEDVHTLTKAGVTIQELIDAIGVVQKQHKIKASPRRWHLHPADRCFVKRLKGSNK